MTDPNTDLADIRQHWLAFCSHDTGLPYPCICPTEDHRPLIAALVGEVETLRAEVARLRGRTHEAVDETQRRYASMQSELSRLQQLMREARDRHAAEMRKAGKPAWSEISGYGQAAAASIIAERDEAQALLRLAPHHQQQVETLEYDLVQAGAEVNRLTAQRDDARADAERMRVVLALHGGGIDPNGYYEGTPGSRLRELLAAERELVQARAEVVRLTAERNDYRRRLDFAEVVAARMRSVVEAAVAYVTRYRVAPSDNLRPLFAAVDQMAPTAPHLPPQSDGQGEVAVTDAVEAPGRAEGVATLWGPNGWPLEMPYRWDGKTVTSAFRGPQAGTDA